MTTDKTIYEQVKDYDVISERYANGIQQALDEGFLYYHDEINKDYITAVKLSELQDEFEHRLREYPDLVKIVSKSDLEYCTAMDYEKELEPLLDSLDYETIVDKIFSENKQEYFINRLNERDNGLLLMYSELEIPVDFTYKNIDYRLF